MVSGDGVVVAVVVVVAGERLVLAGVGLSEGGGTV